MPIASCSSLFPEFAVSKFEREHSLRGEVAEFPAARLHTNHSGGKRETMFTPHSLGIALLMMITSAICWGSWANTYKGVKNYRFELFYWDYALGIFLIAVVLAFTMGNISNDGSSFLNNVNSADPSNFIYTLAGGAV